MAFKFALRLRGIRPKQQARIRLTNEALARRFRPPPPVARPRPSMEDMLRAAGHGVTVGGLGSAGYAAGTGALNHIFRDDDAYVGDDGLPASEKQREKETPSVGDRPAGGNPLAKTGTVKELAKRMRRRRGDDKYNEVNYDSNPGKPDATHEGQEPHGKDAEDRLFAAASRAFADMQRANGRKLAAALLG